MPCYAVALLRNVKIGPEVVAYLEAIDASLTPFDGQFIIHGGHKHMLEGTCASDLIVIAFPDLAKAQGWYASPAYRDIKPFRSKNAEGEIFLIQGVDADHKATDILSS